MANQIEAAAFVLVVATLGARNQWRKSSTPASSAVCEKGTAGTLSRIKESFVSFSMTVPVFSSRPGFPAVGGGGPTTPLYRGFPAHCGVSAGSQGSVPVRAWSRGADAAEREWSVSRTKPSFLSFFMARASEIHVLRQDAAGGRFVRPAGNPAADQPVVGQVYGSCRNPVQQVEGFSDQGELLGFLHVRGSEQAGRNRKVSSSPLSPRRRSHRGSWRSHRPRKCSWHRGRLPTSSYRGAGESRAEGDLLRLLHGTSRGFAFPRSFHRGITSQGGFLAGKAATRGRSEFAPYGQQRPRTE